MAKTTKQSSKKRVKVKDLQAGEKKVSGKDMKKVRGGHITFKDVQVSSVVPKR